MRNAYKLYSNPPYMEAVTAKEEVAPLPSTTAVDINALATLTTALATPTLGLSTRNVPEQTVIDIYNGPDLEVASPDTFCALVRVGYTRRYRVSQNQRRSQGAQPDRRSETYGTFLLRLERDDHPVLISPDSVSTRVSTFYVHHVFNATVVF